MTWEFGRFRLDPRARMLSRDGVTVPLFPKVLDTLFVLVESAGEVLSKDELMRRVWPDTFVQESNLTQNIFILRKTLGDDSIETVPRRGYRFVPDVRRLDEEVLVATRTTVRIVSEEVTTGALRPRVLVASAVIALLLLVGTGFGVARFVRADRAAAPVVARPPALSITRLTTDSRAYDPAISPDGKLVAYKVIEGGLISLWLKDIARSSAVRVMPPSKEDYRGMVFAPDGSELLFRTYPPGVKNGAIVRIPIFGGAPQEVTRDVWSDFAISPDGREVAFLRGSSQPVGTQLIAARTDGSGERTIGTSVYAKTWFAMWESAPAWSPDGRRLAICGWSRDSDGDRPALFEMEVANGATREIAIPRAWGGVSQVAWVHDGAALILAAEEENGSPTQLWELDRASGAARRITNDTSDYRKIRLSADSKLLVAEQHIGYEHLWVLPGGDWTRARQLTFGAGDGDGYSGLAWTPEGRLLFVSDRTGQHQIWSMKPDGSDARQLTASHASVSPAASPDGRHIVYASSAKGRWNVWRMDADGRNAVQLTRGGSEIRPSVSPDGRWVYYTNSAVVPSVIERIPIDGGAPAALRIDGGASAPILSPDGLLLAIDHYDDERGFRNGVMPASGGEPRLFDWHSTRGHVRWLPDSSGIVYIDGANLRVQPLRGPSRPLTQFPEADGPIWNFSLSPDGRDLAVVRGAALADIVLLRQFR